MKNAAFNLGGEHRPFLIPEKASYLQNFHAFATSALADERFTSIVDLLDSLNRKANEIVSQASNEGFGDTSDLQMEIFDLARQYACRYGMG
jgi:hypothetical protein